MQEAARDETYSALSAVFREEAGKLVGALVRLLGNFEMAEELVQDALLIALERWPIEGIPERPGAWLMTVARHRALDQLRRDASYREKLAAFELAADTQAAEQDDRLPLMFMCCHPALSPESQVALTLLVLQERGRKPDERGMPLLVQLRQRLRRV